MFVRFAPNICLYIALPRTDKKSWIATGCESGLEMRPALWEVVARRPDTSALSHVL